jgi:hypothetical protein
MAGVGQHPKWYLRHFQNEPKLIETATVGGEAAANEQGEKRPAGEPERRRSETLRR